jgi:BACON domain-containing protein
MKKRTLLASTLVVLAFLVVTLFIVLPARTKSLAINRVLPPAVGLNFGTLTPKSSETLPLAITNRYSQKVDWVADIGGTIWLTLDRYKGTLQPLEQQTIYVSVNVSSLPVGDYASSITFTQQVLGTMSTSIKVPVTLHIGLIPYGDNGPHAPTVSPSHIDLGTQQTNANSVTLKFQNPVQNGEVDWTVGTGGVSWVILDKSNGTLQGGGQQTVNVTVDTTNLKSGTYQTDLILSLTFANPAKADFEPTSVLVPVTLTVP